MNNRALSGGGIQALATGNFTLDSCEFERNNAGKGGGIVFK